MAYQPFDPRDIGKRITMLFGPLSGGNHAKSIIEEYGFVCEDNEKAAIAQYIKDKFNERRKGVTDGELMQAYFEYRQPIAVERIDYGKNANRATVRLYGRFFDRSGEIQEEHLGKDSALAAVKRAIEEKFGCIEILSHQSRSEGAGINANSRSRIAITAGNGKQYEGEGVDQDIEVSAMRALIDATNRAYVDQYFSRELNVNKEASGGKAHPAPICRAS